MKKFKRFVSEFEECLRDMKIVLGGLLVLIAAAIVVDRALFVWNNEERLVSAEYGVVAWPGESSRFVKNWFNRDYDGYGTVKVARINGLIMTSENFFFYPDGRIETCSYGFRGRSCKPAIPPGHIYTIAQEGSRRLRELYGLN